MIITRTPFRISLFGGGTDYPAWYEENGGVVLSTSIDKYCYITCRERSSFFKTRYRVMYARTEDTYTVEEIKHPVVRETIKHLGVKCGLEIHHDADLPAMSGVGSSSAFAVGFLSALRTLINEPVKLIGYWGKLLLASEATYIERQLVKDNVGDQDQIAVSLGGLNRIEFKKSGNLVTPIDVSMCEHIHGLEGELMLFHTGIDRYATEVANTIKFTEDLKELQTYPDIALKALQKGDLKTVGELLDKSWAIKKSTSPMISNTVIDEVYCEAKQAGARGGKIIGAGAGGFIMLMVPIDKQKAVIERLHKLTNVSFKFENKGTEVIFNNESEKG